MASAPSHPSRRDNQSTSSTHSQRSDRSGRSHTNNPAVESAVTKLLVSIKLLLEALTLWSNLKMTELQVSDVYVRLGNDFNAAVAAFGQFNIDMSELLSVPEDLRMELEQCLSEDATPGNLEIYLPRVRQIITNLLQGLRNKQSIYRRIVSERRRQTSDSQLSRSSRSDGRVTRADSSGLPRSQLVRPAATLEDGTVRGPTDASSSRRVASSRRHAPQSSISSSQTEADAQSGGGFVRPQMTGGDGELRSPQNEAPLPALPEYVVNGDTSVQSPTQKRLSRRSIASSQTEADDPNDTTIRVSTPPPNSMVPPSVPRYSLTDAPMPPAVVVDEATPTNSEDNVAALANESVPSETSSPPPETPPIEPSQAPVIASSLAALKGSDVLERRASKRFSSYNISKMTGGVRERLGSGRSMSNRRSMAVDSSNLTPSDLDVLTEVDESQATTRRADSGRSKSRGAGGSSTRKPRAGTPVGEEPVPPLPESATTLRAIAPTPPAKEVIETSTSHQTVDSHTSEVPSSPSSSSSQITVFLQVGREVKKVTIEPGLSFGSLRVLFVDKFSYSPGQDNFPAIYIRDPSSGVQYELEDVDEVKDRCLLSLNIEPLDQIKQHIDLQMSSLAEELKELRSVVTSNSRRLSHQPTIIAQPFAESTPPAHRPTDKQFQRLARRLSRITHVPEESSRDSDITPQSTGTTLLTQMTGGSVFSETTGRIVSDLKTQFDEVQNLRRDLGVMRQVYVDFIGQTKESLASLRTQTQSVKQLASTKIGGERAYVNQGKASLDSRSQNVLTRVEELQDTVENLKEDVLKRHVSPRSNVVKTAAKEIEEVATELQSLKEHLRTVKPMWKKTWEAELQNIVDEQQFLNHQEEFLNDLLDDHKALSEVFGHIGKVISIRSAGQVKPRGYRPPPPEEGHGGLTTVMMEIRNAAIDPEKRLKAIAQNQKAREKERAVRGDEFEEELAGFVKGKRLKLTGGAEEAERVRQKRNDMALKAMFTGGSATSIASSGTVVPSASANGTNM